MKVLNVGGNNKSIPLPDCYAGWEHHLLDIDASGNPDICCDARELKDKIEFQGLYDSVYCSHNIEHYYLHNVKDVLAGFHMVLNNNGFCYIAVPHMMNVLRRVVAYNMDLLDPLYHLSDGTPIAPHDVMFGWGKQIEQSGQEFFAHKCAFTPKMMNEALNNAGFNSIIIHENDLELIAFAFKNKDDARIINA